jgi:protein arginine N-methyltransferase 5
MLSQQRKLYCGRTITPEALATGGAGWDFVAVPLSSEGRIAFSDLDLPVSTWRAHVIGLLTAADPALFAREISWGRHLMVPAMICPIELAEQIELLRQLRAHLLDPLSQPLLVRVPWTADGWRRWHRVRRLADWDRRLNLCLESSQEPPDLERFLAEGVDCLWIAEKPDHEAVRALFAGGTDRAIVVSGDPRLGVEVRSLFSVYHPVDEKLVPPVQPLRDHLHSSIYAQFERAVPKYEHYHRAIRAALVAKRPKVVAVAGAGRGPLVQAVLRAATEVHQTPRVYAVEKNPNAAVTLRSRNEREWGGRAEVIEADMRSWSPPHAVDVLVSELLGAFADNELSPECLDGAERWLAPDGISIPRRTTSFVAPMFAPRLVSIPERPVGISSARTRLLAAPQPCFVFEHPHATPDHRRVRELAFTSACEAAITGFAGFFEAELFGDVMISTRPETETPDMEGWSTFYFPLLHPLEVPRGGEIRAAFFRERDQRRVWYEWVVLAPGLSQIHNAGGRTEVMSL